MRGNPIVACVGGYIDESQDGRTWRCVDAYQNLAVDVDAARGRAILAAWRKDWPHGDYLDGIRRVMREDARLAWAMVRGAK